MYWSCFLFSQTRERKQSLLLCFCLFHDSSSDGYVRYANRQKLNKLFKYYSSDCVQTACLKNNKLKKTRNKKQHYNSQFIIACSFTYGTFCFLFLSHCNTAVALCSAGLQLCVKLLNRPENAKKNQSVSKMKVKLLHLLLTVYKSSPQVQLYSTSALQIQ